MDDNWAALYLSIYKKVPPEVAFYMMETGRQVSDRTYSNIFTDQDTEDMKKLREEKITYREIGEMYGVRESTVFQRIKRFKNKGIKKEA